MPDLSRTKRQRQLDQGPIVSCTLLLRVCSGGRTLDAEHTRSSVGTVRTVLAEILDSEAAATAMDGMTADTGLRQRVIEIALALLLVLLLIAATLRILLPFAGILTYAVILSTATAGLFERMAKLLNGRRRFAAFLFGIVAGAITVVPVLYLSSAVADAVPIVQQWLNAASSHELPNLPDWIAGLPLIGGKVAAAWQELQVGGLSVLQHYQHQLVAVGRW